MPPRRRPSEAQKAALARANAARREAYRAKTTTSSLPSTGSVPVDVSPLRPAPASDSANPTTGSVPVNVSPFRSAPASGSSIPSTGPTLVGGSSASSSDQSSRTTTTETTTSSADSSSRSLSANSVRGIDLPPTAPLSRSTSVAPTCEMPATTTAPTARSASAGPTTVPLTRGPGPRSDTDIAQPMDEDPPQEAEQPATGHEDAPQDQDRGADRAPTPGPSNDVRDQQETTRQSTAAEKRRRVQLLAEDSDEEEGGVRFNKHFPLPDDAFNSRRRVKSFPENDIELEPGFKVSSTTCEGCREYGIWCTYGTGFDFKKNERGPGIDKCDFCKVRGRKCDLIPGKTTKRQKADESLQHVYKKLEKLSRRTDDRKMARALGDLSREAEEVYRFYTKKKPEPSSSSSDSD